MLYFKIISNLKQILPIQQIQLYKDIILIKKELTMQDKALYSYIKSFIILGERNERFIQSLSREYGWSQNFSKKAYEEYLRFIYLTSIEESPLSPSSVIDKVWKFHLGYSDSYWLKLCENILKKPLHRNFSSKFNKGIEKEFFIDTYELYEKEFQEKPPFMIWGTHHRYLNNLLNNGLMLWSKKYCIILSMLFITIVY